IDESGTELSSIMDPGSHGSTYGGNPLAATVSLAVLREVVSEGLPERAHRLGTEIRAEIESWNLPVVQGVRGLGLLLGIGLNPEMVDAPEGKTIASVVVESLRQEGLLSVPAGPETVRLLPPLNVSEEEVQQALAIIRRVLKTYVK
ncbi:aminotransferase class III-fold pyridoxal phosphate-dependent enzyme, partial [Akkermansia sp.]